MQRLTGWIVTSPQRVPIGCGLLILRIVEPGQGSFTWLSSLMFSHRLIVGWHAMTTRPTELVTVPLRMALWNRRHEGSEIFEGLIHHSDAGSQYVSLKFSEELMLEGVLASIGSVGDAYDNALAETTIGLFKTEAIRPGNPFHPGPFKTIEDIEFAGLGLG